MRDIEFLPLIAVPVAIVNAAGMAYGAYVGDARTFVLGWFGAVLASFGYLEHREDKKGT